MRATTVRQNRKGKLLMARWGDVRQTSGYRGFSLVEVQIALFILIVALLGLISITVLAVKNNNLNKTTTTAVTLAGDLVERLRQSAFTATDLSSGSHTDSANPINGVFTRTWTVTDTTDVTGSQVLMKNVVVNVTWNWQGTNKQVSLQTLIAKPL